jgi:hypothetical protein
MAFDLTFWPGGSWDWTDAALNWGAGQVAKLLGLTYVTAPATVTSKKAPIPADAVSVVNCIGGRLGMGKVLMESTFQTEDMKNPNWRSRQGEPSVWIQQDGATILLNGDPSTGAILVGYIQIPTPMVEPADEPDPRIPPEFHQHLRYAAAAYLYQISTKVKNLEMASKMFAIFTTELGLGPLPLAQISVQR